MDDVSATECQLYLPGHKVHYLQARLSHDRGKGRFLPARVISSSDADIGVVVMGRERHLRNHHMARLRRHLGAEILFHERLGLLKIPSGGYLFCVTDADLPWTPCRSLPAQANDSGEVLAERLRSAGGFVIASPAPPARGT